MEIEPMNEIFIINEIELKLTTTDFRCLSLILTAVSDLTLTTVCRMIHLRPGNWECNKLRAIGAGTWARDFFNSDIDHHFHFPVLSSESHPLQVDVWPHFQVTASVVQI